MCATIFHPAPTGPLDPGGSVQAVRVIQEYIAFHVSAEGRSRLLLAGFPSQLVATLARSRIRADVTDLEAALADIGLAPEARFDPHLGPAGNLFVDPAKPVPFLVECALAEGADAVSLVARISEAMRSFRPGAQKRDAEPAVTRRSRRKRAAPITPGVPGRSLVRLLRRQFNGTWTWGQHADPKAAIAVWRHDNAHAGAIFTLMGETDIPCPPAQDLPDGFLLASAGFLSACGKAVSAAPAEAPGLPGLSIVRDLGHVPANGGFRRDPIVRTYSGLFASTPLDTLRIPATVLRRLNDLGAFTVKDAGTITCGQILDGPGLRPKDAMAIAGIVAEANRREAERSAAQRRKEMRRKAARRAREGLEIKMVRLVRLQARAIKEGRLYQSVIVPADCPEWFLATPLAELRVTGSLQKALKGVQTIGGLARMSVIDLIQARSVGPRRIDILRGAVRNLLALKTHERREDQEAMSCVVDAILEDVKDAPRPTPYTLRDPVLDAIRGNIAELNARALHIVSRKLGIDGPPATLHEIGTELGLTRERVRQILMEAIYFSETASAWVSVIRSRFQAMGAEAPVLADEVLSEPWARGMDQDTLRAFLEQFSTLYLVDIPHVGTVVAPFHQTKWRDLYPLVRARVAAADIGMDLPALLRDIADAVGIEDPAHRAAIKLLPRIFAGCDIVGIKIRCGAAVDALERIVRGHGAPIHLHEVVARIQTSMPSPPSRRSIHTQLNALAVNLGKGLYRWNDDTGGLTPEEARLAEEAVALVMQGVPGWRWDAGEILAGLRRTKGDAFSWADEALLVDVLKADGRLRQVGGCRWTDTRLPETHKTFEKTVEAILERNGAPMRTVDLKAALNELWGARNAIQFRVSGRLVQVGYGLWGLIDRDLPLDDDGMREVVGMARQAMTAGARTIAEVHASLRQAEPAYRLANQYELASVLRARGGMAMDMAGNIRDQGDAAEPRPGTITHRVRELLRTTGRGLTASEVLALLSTGVDAPPSLALVRIALNKHGVLIGSNPQRWCLPGLEHFVQAQSLQDVAPRRKRTRIPSLRGAEFDWTDARIGVMVRMWQDGSSGTAIAKALGHGATKNSVISKLNRMGVTREVRADA